MRRAAAIPVERWVKFPAMSQVELFIRMLQQSHCFCQKQNIAEQKLAQSMSLTERHLHGQQPLLIWKILHDNAWCSTALV